MDSLALNGLRGGAESLPTFTTTQGFLTSVDCPVQYEVCTVAEGSATSLSSGRQAGVTGKGRATPSALARVISRMNMLMLSEG